MDHIEDFINAWFYVVNLFRESCFKKIPNREGQLLAGQNLPRRRHREVILNGDRASVRGERACNHLENGALPGAVLPHQGDLRSTPDQKIRLIQDGLPAVLERNFIESEDDVGVWHGIRKAHCWASAWI